MVEIAPAPPARRYVLWADAEAAGPIGAAFGVPLPQEPCRAREAAGRAALRLGPGEWLLLAPDGDPFTPPPAPPHSLVDVSDGTTALLLRGPGAARALSAGCPLDLHPRAFPPGMATRTVLSRIGIVLWRRTADEWRVEVARSCNEYAHHFLAEAARFLPAF